MIHVGIEVKLPQVLNVLEESINDLQRKKQRLLEPNLKDENIQSVPVSKILFGKNRLLLLFFLRGNFS